MNRLLKFSLLAIVLSFMPWVQAHEGHNHMPVTMKKAVEIALATTADYTRKAPPFGLPQLDESWRNLPASAAQIHENGRGYYVVGIANPAQAKTLYLRILLDGSVDAANFSGVFAPSAPTSSAE